MSSSGTGTVLSTHNSTTGFYKAPVCKGLIITSIIASSAIHLPSFNSILRQYLNCQVPHILTNYTQIWRLIFNRLTFVHSKDILCSILVLYYFRIFERRMGSRKFASQLLASCSLATILEIAIILFTLYYQIDLHSGGNLPSGMYGIIFPMYVNYYLDIPRVAVTHFLGIPVTGKTITYLLGLQIASTSPASIISALSGIIGGLLYRWNFLKIQKWLYVPKTVAVVFDKIFGWALNTKEPKQNMTGATIELQRQEQVEMWEEQYFHNRAQDFRQARGQGYSERLLGPNIPEPEDGGRFGLGNFFRQRRPNNVLPEVIEGSEENIQLLIDMGFERERAVEALRRASNDLETALAFLFAN